MAKILVVDDEVDMRMALGNVLSRTGHQVFEAGDGPTALQFLGRESVDLVLLDIRMPGMDGVQILRKLRETDRTTPVIMVTGYGSVESAVEVMQLGASHYLAKPFSNRDLVESVEKVLVERKAPGSGGPPGPGAEEKAKAAAQTRLPAFAGKTALDAAPLALPGPSRRGPWVPWTALAAGAALALGAWALLVRPGREVRMPFKNPTAVVWRGDRLWVADWVTQTVYEAKVSGGALQVLRSVPLPQTHITGLALAGEHLFLCDSWRQVVQKRKLDDKLSLVAAVRSPGPDPAGLYFDGRYLWSADASTRKFYQHEVDGPLTVLASYPAPGRSPVAIYKDERFLWSADSETRLIYQHRLDNKLGVLSTYRLEQLDPGPAPLSSFTWKGSDLWLVRDGSGILLERRLSDFAKLSRGGAS